MFVGFFVLHGSVSLERQDQVQKLLGVKLDGFDFEQTTTLCLNTTIGNHIINSVKKGSNFILLPLNR